MNYAAATKAIREERRAIWEGLGKPVMVRRWKPRQLRMTPVWSPFEHIPWSDLYYEDYFNRMSNFFGVGKPWLADWSQEERMNFLRTKWEIWAALEKRP
jgi:hypothetical protein